MSAKRRNSKGKPVHPSIKSRVDAALKERLVNYCKRPDVKRSEGFVLRRAVEELLAKEGAGV